MTFESNLAGGVALYDVSDQLPRRATPTRPVAAVDRVFVHHSGRLGRPGVAGAVASARYVVERRNFPTAAYHYWIPAATLLDEVGRLVVLRLVPDGVRSWHTGGEANTRGVAVCLQGNTTAAPLTESHVEGLEALLPWLAARFDLAGPWLSWHAEADRHGGRRKAACPGAGAVAWLADYRARLG